NFRIIYLFMIPVLAALVRNKAGRFFFFFLFCLCLTHPLVFAVVTPSALLYGIVAGKKRWGMSLTTGGVLAFVLISILYAGFYRLLGVKEVSSAYAFHSRDLIFFYGKSYRYVLLTIAGSLLYVSLLCVAAWAIARLVKGKAANDFLKERLPMVAAVALLLFCSVCMARMLDFRENAYQLAYIGYIAVSLLLFGFFAVLAADKKKYALLVLLIYASGYLAYKYREGVEAFDSVFRNNRHRTDSRPPYTSRYLDSVTAIVQALGTANGAYIADTGYYKSLYYSLHNPLVYHLPVTYILSDRVQTNMDFCLSDTTAIYYGVGEGIAKSYLANAVARSYFHNGFAGVKGSVRYQDLVASFIKSMHIRYLFITKDIAADLLTGLPIDRIIVDAGTGERFLLLKEELF
ncbi:MAG: hypothetical protein JST39_21315, partial [Bacteroidetes bacterium]|nr:hypothetical protein [Bacteroidota bacterium]